ncbi:MAG: hypothetical protein JWM19_1532, partial [Actinomycetia bacterium]|nr:hypothetical protein [Actinomycetes bacterium]
MLPSSTGRRPVRSTMETTCSTEADDAPSMRAVGMSHIPRTTWVNKDAVVRSTMITLDDGPMAEH